MQKRQLLVDVRSGRTRPAMGRSPVVSSASAPWRDVMIERHASGPTEIIDCAALDHTIIVQREESAVREIRYGSDPLYSGRLLPGQVCLIPAMLPYSVKTMDTGEFIAVSLNPQFVLCSAYPLLTADRLELIPQAACDDPLLLGVTLALKAELNAGCPGGRLYAESLGAALAVHLVRCYSAQKPNGHLNGGGLTPFQLRHAVDFLQAHLAEDVSLKVLAATVGLSPFHFARLFKKSIGLAPHQYLVKCRVERARALLLREEASVADIAMQVGFCDQSHLAAHFKRIYGVTPKAFAQRTS